MEKNEIKKALYKEKPIAKKLESSTKEIYKYSTMIGDYDYKIPLTEIFFDVPVSDMGDATFEKEMEAKHLIRWITK
tara:strand:- start:1078 stop:1305 length:228 start_codon:yes stop_codon:yes gene_type:complete